MIHRLRLLALWLLPFAALAHDIVLVPNGKTELTVRCGHPGDWQRVDERRLVELHPYAQGAAGGAPQQRLADLRPVPAGFGKAPLDMRLADRGTDTRLVAARYTTDANGMVQVPLLPNGRNVIVVGAEHANDGSLVPKDRVGGADRLALVATFSFVRP